MAPFSEIASWMLVCQDNTDGVFLQVSSKYIPQSYKKLRVEIHLDSPCFSRWMYTARDAAGLEPSHAMNSVWRGPPVFNGPSPGREPTSALLLELTKDHLSSAKSEPSGELIQKEVRRVRNANKCANRGPRAGVWNANPINQFHCVPVSDFARHHQYAPYHTGANLMHPR